MGAQLSITEEDTAASITGDGSAMGTHTRVSRPEALMRILAVEPSGRANALSGLDLSMQTDTEDFMRIARLC